MPLITQDLPILTPDAYDRAEAEAAIQVPARIIEALCPQNFIATGYPVRVSDARELWRYVDAMHETRLRETFDSLLEGLTTDEFALFRRAVEFVIKFTTASFGRPLHCENALLRAMNIYRYIRAMEPHAVLEVGPGSGYLGLLHILEGVAYIAFDSTQAFYLLQNHMWAAAAGSRFNELAMNDLSLRDVLARPIGDGVIHVPWWKFVDLDIDSLPGKVDVVTANHCMTEMHTNAFKYYLRLAAKVLPNSQSPFLFEGSGHEFRSRGTIGEEFNRLSYRLCHADNKVTAFVPAGNPGEQYGQLPHKVLFRQQLRDVARYISGLESLRYEFWPDDFCGRNVISEKIRSSAQANKTVKYQEVSDFLTRTYGAGTGVSEEERFLKLIGSY